MPVRSVCVFCGAHAGGNPAYEADAEALGRALAEEGWRLVYGAGDVGLMGAAARAAKTAGGLTLGIVPAHLAQREAGRSDPATHVVTETMHERKKVMFMNSDAIAVLPGGAGSLDEFFEALTWRQLGLHAKPVVLLDTAGYWRPLVALIDHVITEGFADAGLRDYVTVCGTVAELRASLRAAFS
ncbi:MAG: TIGR00730 family Rossman fold protein [Roseovarius sp.]|nr:TIGR00730 family Rossman fold protein [Roseovarius sp.]